MARSAHPSLRRPLPAYGRDAAHYDAPHRPLRAATAAGSSICCRSNAVTSCSTSAAAPACASGSCRNASGPVARSSASTRRPTCSAVAAERVSAARVDATSSSSSRPCEDADLPDGAHHALFCAVHDVLQSPAALDRRARAPCARAARWRAGGGKWAPGLGRRSERRGARHARALRAATSPASTGRGPTSPSGCPELTVREVAMGGGYLASGACPRSVGLPPSGNGRSARGAESMMAA